MGALSFENERIKKKLTRDFVSKIALCLAIPSAYLSLLYSGSV